MKVRGPEGESLKQPTINHLPRKGGSPVEKSLMDKNIESLSKNPDAPKKIRKISHLGDKSPIRYVIERLKHETS